MTSHLDKYQEEIAQLKQWIDDLQSGMYINCVYCGHRYGPKDQVPASMADVLKAHIEQCPKHPMSKLKADNARMLKVLKLTYRKHWLDDASVGYHELGDELYNELCREMGEDEFIRFVEEYKK